MHSVSFCLGYRSANGSRNFLTRLSVTLLRFILRGVKYSPLFFLLLLSRLAFGACVDTGQTMNCTQGVPGTWDHYSDTTGVLYSGACGTQCDCGEVPSGLGPCHGCSHQAKMNSSECYSNSACSTPCTPIPELSTAGEASTSWIAYLILLPAGLLYWWTRRAKLPTV